MKPKNGPRLLGGLDHRQGPWLITKKHPKAAEIGSFLGASVEFGGPGSPTLVAQNPLGMIGGMVDP
jgi:hypothetical protein